MGDRSGLWFQDFQTFGLECVEEDASKARFVRIF